MLINGIIFVLFFIILRRFLIYFKFIAPYCPFPISAALFFPSKNTLVYFGSSVFSRIFYLLSALPEKVHFAIKLPVPGEALLGEVAAAFAALDALGVPGSVQHVEEEPVQDGPFAPGTVDHHVSDLQDAECRPSQPDCACRTGTTFWLR